MATSGYGVNSDAFYVAGRPKAESGLMKVLETVGNTLAEEKELPRPGSRVETTEKGMEVLGCQTCSGTSAYLELSRQVERLKMGAGMGGLWVDFEFDDKNGSIVKTEVTGRKKLPGLAEEVTKSHYFKVKGYVSHKYPLPKNIDLIQRGENLEKVKAVIEEAGKENVVYSMLDELMSYSPDSAIVQSNTEKAFGLNEDKLYHDLKGLLKEEVSGKYDELKGSKIAGLSDSRCRILKFIGSKYREHKAGKIEEHRAKKEKQIDTLRWGFSEPYKSVRRQSIFSPRDWRAEGRPPCADAV